MCASTTVSTNPPRVALMILYRMQECIKNAGCVPGWNDRFSEYHQPHAIKVQGVLDKGEERFLCMS